MGDENSLSGSTKAHKHSALSSDGGFLETSTTGMTNLSNGSLIMGDASEIQTEIPAGSNLDVLTMGATQPAWVTPIPAVSGWEELASVSATSGTSISTPVFTPKKYLMIWSFLNVSTSMSFQVGSTTLDSSSNYAQTEMYTDGTTVATGAQASRSNLECFYQTGGTCLVTANIVNIATQQKVMDISAKGMATSSTGGIKNFSGLWYNNTNQIDIVGWSGSTITEANIVVFGRD